VTSLLPSIDLDDAWAYLRARGLSGWEAAPTVIPLAADRFRGLLEEADIAAATVFVVGRDARLAPGRAAIHRFQAKGWEIADHSLEHRGELASRPSQEIRRDLVASREAIAQVTGTLPAGFRCPSFGASPSLSGSLRALGYAYDASPLPTSLVPLLRLYHRIVAGHGEHAPSYGNLRSAFGPLRAHRRDGMVEVPTTTLPVLRLPFHGSYLSALASRSVGLASAYARFADRLCRTSRLDVSFLLHPTDVLDRDDAPHLAFFPGMDVPWARKRQLLVEVLRRLSDGRRVITLGAAAAQAQPAMRH
jgi:hypothetical protein